MKDKIEIPTKIIEESIQKAKNEPIISLNNKKINKKVKDVIPGLNSFSPNQEETSLPYNSNTSSQGKSENKLNKEDKEKQLKLQQEKELKAKAQEKDDQTSKLLNKITLRLQTLLSIYPKVEEKLACVLIKFISPEHIKNILEERDCNNFCGNFLCDRVLNKEKEKDKRLFYNPETKKFTKDDLLSFFCNVKCFQIFKDFCKVAESFDYLYLTSKESTIIFNILIDYFPNNKYLKQISDIAKELITLNKIEMNETYKSIRDKLNKLFIEDLDQYLNFDDVKITEESVDVSALFNSNVEKEAENKGKEIEQKNFKVLIKK